MSGKSVRPILSRRARSLRTEYQLSEPIRKTGPHAPFAQDEVRSDSPAHDQAPDLLLALLPQLLEREQDLVLDLLERSERERPSDLSFSIVGHRARRFGFQEAGHGGTETRVGEGEPARERLRKDRCWRQRSLRRFGAIRRTRWNRSGFGPREGEMLECCAWRAGTQSPGYLQIPCDLVDGSADTLVVGSGQDGEGRDGPSEEQESMAA